MPDLSLESVHAFWDSYDRRVLYRVIVGLESVESWAADNDPKIEEAIIKLGKAMDMSHNVDFTGYEDKIINILAYLKASRAIKILQTIDNLNPGSAAKLFLDRNLVF
ncbi:MAG: hypothetical protein ACR2HS_00530 [Gammaproteobacteria bacterium]